MATYFDPDDPYAISLLSDEARARTDLATVATMAERDVIDAFTSQAGYPDGLWDSTLYTFTIGTYTYVVNLLGYAADAADAAGYNATMSAWTGFARDFRGAIARVVDHRLKARIARVDDFAEELSVAGAFEVTRRVAYDPRWPEAWDRTLKRLYDRRAPAFI